jgi:alpha-L-rhamnosidase
LFLFSPGGEERGGGTPAPQHSRDTLKSDRHPAFLAFGPFQSTRPQAFDLILVEPSEIFPTATRDRFDAAWQRGHLNNDDLAQPFARPMTNDMIVTTDIYALSASERIDPTITPHVDNPSALLTDSDDWTTIQPFGIRHSEIGTRLLLDFAHEVVGYHEFELDAPAGAILDNHNFEFIQRDGRFNLAEGMNNSFRYICREGVQRYRTFVRRGFRYSWLTFRNFNRPIRIRFVRMLMSTYPQTGAGDFECSDALLNDIWRASVLSVRCCSEDTYTDCPTYEQTFWVGDARNEAIVDLIANGDPRLSAHCLKLAGQSLDRSPVVESQVPSGWQNILPTWSFLWMRWAQEHHLFTGDNPIKGISPFKKGLIPFIERNVQGIVSNTNDNGLFQLHAWNLFDWAGMDTPAAGVVTHVNCFAVQGLRQCAELAKQLGFPAKGKQWSKLADKIESAINAHLWSDDKQAYVDCIRPDGTLSPIFSQQTQTAAYISGVAKGAREERCREIVHHAPPGFITAGSPFYMFFLLEALARENRILDLLDTIRSYWGKQIQAGATTFWEMFHPTEPRLTRSHCHGWSAAPVVFLTQYVLGIRPLQPGYSEVLIAPGATNLNSAQGRVPTPHGPIDCYWTNNDRHLSLRVNLPKNITARIELPYDGQITVAQGKINRTANAIIARGPLLQLTLRKSAPPAA